jgi:hypothetical protein
LWRFHHPYQGRPLYRARHLVDHQGAPR